VGANVAKLDEIYAPETHAAALDPATAVVVGSRGTGKSFWASVLGQDETRETASIAYPRLGLGRVIVKFGFTGLGGPEGIGVDALNACVPPDAGIEQAKAFWWATVLRAAAQSEGKPSKKLSHFMAQAVDWESREELLAEHEQHLRHEDKILLVIYDALDRLATNWPRRRLLTEALLEVAWEMRAFRAIRPTLFFRPDQIEDDALKFVELPKLRTGAVRLNWSQVDLYGLVFSRLVLAPAPEAQSAFGQLMQMNNISQAKQKDILSRHWELARKSDLQQKIMTELSGPYMASGRFGFKKGGTYDWAFKHLADSFFEVTPRSFLGLVIAAAQYGFPPENRAMTPEGIRHGLRAASKTRVDQLHQDFAWIKGVLAPLAGLLMPQDQDKVFSAWKSAKTVSILFDDANKNKYLPPIVHGSTPSESDLYFALERIGVMSRRKDGRIDMPDLFRVAAKLLKKGGTAPV
jgi:hypothetical protein